MSPKEVIALRLLNHQILETSFALPEEIISYYGAMQAQDWSMAKWALGLRLPHLREKDVDHALNEGLILRTHMLRPTWHLVAPRDIRWMQQLTAHRVHQLNKMYYRKFDLEGKVFLKTEKILIKALAGYQFKTRDELREYFNKNKFVAEQMRFVYILMHAELEGLICSGPRKGKQFTYALLEERVEKSKEISIETALKKLTRIYFHSRGPATVHDYSWWSGLTIKEARAGIEMLGKQLVNEVMEGIEYFFTPTSIPQKIGKQATFLMPDYDEYGISYKDRSIYLHPKWKETEKLTNADYFHAIVVDGYFGGSWNKKLSGKQPVVTIRPFSTLTMGQKNNINKSVKAYNRFFRE